MKFFYWGDIDTQGLEVLSQFRGYFSNTKEFLMSESVFKEFAGFSKVKGSTTVRNLTDGLTQYERQFYNFLKENNYRLEQEKIPQDYVVQHLQKIGLVE